MSNRCWDIIQMTLPFCFQLFSDFTPWHQMIKASQQQTGWIQSWTTSHFRINYWQNFISDCKDLSPILNLDNMCTTGSLFSELDMRFENLPRETFTTAKAKKDIVVRKISDLKNILMLIWSCYFTPQTEKSRRLNIEQKYIRKKKINRAFIFDW